MKITKRKDGLFRGSVKLPDSSYKSVYGKTKGEVKEKIKEINSEIQKGLYVKPVKETFKEYSLLWLENYTQNLTISTLQQYTYIINNHLLPVFGEKQLQKFNRSDVQKFINSLNATYSTKTIKNILNVLSQIFKEAVIDEKLSKNPCEYIKIKKKEPVKRQSLELEQVKILLELSKEYKEGEMIELLLLTGMRIGELVGIFQDAINFNEKTLTIKRQLSRDRKSYTLPKHGKIREIPLSDRAFEILEKNINGDNPLFPKIAYKNINTTLKKIGKVIDVPSLSAHVLRHTYATLLIEAGVSIKTIQENLGHHTSDFTLEHYTHSTLRNKKRSAQIIDNLLSEQTEIW